MKNEGELVARRLGHAAKLTSLEFMSRKIRKTGQQIMFYIWVLTFLLEFWKGNVTKC